MIGRNKMANQCVDFSYTLHISYYMCLEDITHETVCFVTEPFPEVPVLVGLQPFTVLESTQLIKLNVLKCIELCII